MTMELYLINEVCKREVLWNDKHKLHTSPFHYRAAWEEVANLVGVKVEEAIKEWKSLVARFVRECKNFDGTDADWKKCTFNYYNMMLFLKDAKNVFDVFPEDAESLAVMFPEEWNDHKPLYSMRDLTVA